MKTHSAIEPGRPGGPAPGLRFLPRAAWAFFLALTALFSSAPLNAQSFIPIIEEVIALEDNDTIFDPDGDTPAVIIIKNVGVVTASLSGWSLTDDPLVPRKWVFPTVTGGGLTLAENQTLAVFASAKNKLTPPYATNFLLPCGSTGYLYNPQSALRSQKTVYSRDCPECLSVFNTDTLASWLIPTATNPPSTGPDWRLPSFTGAGQWPRGQRCLGYDTDPLMANMILYASFDAVDVNTTTRVITDISGPTLHNGTWALGAATPNIGIPITNPARVNQSVQFFGPNNPNSFTSYAHHAELNPGTGSYSFSVWVRPGNDAAPANEVIFRKGGTATTDTGYQLTRQQNSGARFRIQTTSATPVDIGFTSIVVANSWTHIMVVIERVTGPAPIHQLRIYRNGVQMNALNIPAATSIASASQPLVQAQGGSGLAMFQGHQDDFVTWGRALTPAEVTRVFDAGNAGKKVDDPTAPGAQAAIYGPCIQTNVQTAMKGVNTSLYERLTFGVPNPALVNSMTLKVKYDDGFIAYINGVEIARRNAPTSLPLWNSAALTDRPDASALVPEEIPVPLAGLSALVAGTGNVLAIHALNFKVDDQRFLICPELCYTETRPEDCFITTNGRDFWITFPGNAPEDPPGNPLKLSVCITGNAGTTGNVSIPGLSFSQNFTLPAGGKTEVFLPKEASLDKSNTIEKKGVHIVSSKNVAVYGKTRIDFSTDTFLAHPYRVLGSHYLVMGWQNVWNGYPILNGTQFGIVATKDNTHVTVIPKVTTGGHPAGVPYNFVLHEGQTYLLRNLADSPADLTGTEITSDAPVAVFGGHRCANVNGVVFFCDTVLEQTLPVALWGTEYCTAPLFSRSGELVRVLASENATAISINGVAQPGVLNKGDKRDFNIAGGTTISSTRKFLAAHLSRSWDADDVEDADPFQINAQPTVSWLSGYKFCTAPAAEFGTHYCNLIARSAELAGVVVSPAPALSGPITAIPGTPYSYRQMTLAAGTTYVSSGRTHGLEIYSWDQFDSLGHSGGMGFNDTQGPTFTQCPPDITIFVPAAGQLAELPDLAAQFGVADNCCPPQTISVDQVPKPGTRLQIGDHTVNITAIDCVGNRTICIVIVHVRTDPRAAAFPTAFGNPALEATVWGWTANPDGDFLTNEQEYMLGTDMAVASTLGDAFTFRRVVRNGEVVLELSYRRRNDDPALEYNLEGGNNLDGWFGGLGHFEDISQVPDALAGFTRVTAWSVDSGLHDRFFVRLQLRRN